MSTAKYFLSNIEFRLYKTYEQIRGNITVEIEYETKILKL